jgi:threonine dehydratase
MLHTQAQLEAAAQIVYAAMPPTPQYRWPLLGQHLGAGVWVKHENHTTRSTGISTTIAVNCLETEARR